MRGVRGGLVGAKAPPPEMGNGKKMGKRNGLRYFDNVPWLFA